MNPRSFSTDQLHAALADIGGTGRPDYLAAIVAEAGRTRQRPRWTLRASWVPVDIAVGRQGVPRAALVFATLFLLVALLAAGLVYIGAQRIQPDRLSRLPTTAAAWERVQIELASGQTGSVASLAASAQGLLSVVEVENGPNELLASTDGRDWTRVPPDEHPAVGTDGAGWALVGTDRGFLLSNGDVWFSADGFAWELVASRSDDPALGHGEMLALVAGGPGYVGVGNGNSAWYSTDGSSWTLAEVPPPPTQLFESRGFAAPEVDMRGLAVAGDTLVAWGTASRHTEESGLTSPVMWTSRDGRTWSNVVDPGDGEGPDANAMTAGPGGFAALGDENGRVVVRRSADGSAWQQVAVLGDARSHDADGRPLDLDVPSIAASDAGFVAVGGRGPACLMAGVPCGPDEALIWTSVDGASWSQLARDERFARAGASDVVAWGDRFVAGGTQDGRPVIWLSGSAP